MKRPVIATACAFTLAFALTLSACEGEDETFSCSWEQTSGVNAGTCLYYGVAIPADKRAELEQMCSSSGGVSSAESCPTANLVGRCVQFEGTAGEVTYYYYPNFGGGQGDPKEMAEAGCSALPGRWEEPS